MSATIITFPARQSPRNTFSPADIGELVRWDHAVAASGYFLQFNDDDDTGEETWIGTADNGQQYAHIAHVKTGSVSLFMVDPRAVGWCLTDTVAGRAMGTFGSLADALETIHATRLGVASALDR